MQQDQEKLDLERFPCMFGNCQEKQVKFVLPLSKVARAMKSRINSKLTGTYRTCKLAGFIRAIDMTAIATGSGKQSTLGGW